jgi:hypothetical protein
MPQTCTICRLHDADRATLEAALHQGTPLRTIADQYGVSKTALLRHKQHGNSAAAPAGCPGARDLEALATAAHQVHQQALHAVTPVQMVQTLRAMAALLVRLTRVDGDV